MSGHHKHASCDHEVAWCRHCDVIYCNNCEMVWGKPCRQMHWGLGSSYTQYNPYRYTYGTMPMGTAGSIGGQVHGYNSNVQMSSNVAPIPGDEPQAQYQASAKCDHARIS